MSQAHTSESPPGAIAAPPPEPPPKPAAPPRALALDALRGLAIIGMVISGRVPYGEGKALPGWMYHAQNPPPTGGLDTSIPGFTWVDLVFPAFLFSMGVAIPFAASRRLAKGYPAWKLAASSFWRMVSLSFFGIFFAHASPWTMDQFLPWAEQSGIHTVTWLLCLLGFALMFPIYLRFPPSWPGPVQWTIRTVGVGAAALYLFLIYGGEFSLYRSNIILMVLANMAFFGMVIWLLTRGGWLVRLGSLAVLYAMREAVKVEGSWVALLVQDPTNWLPFEVGSLGWFYNFDWLKYLFLVVPGTMVGEMLMDWMKSGSEAEAREAWTPGRLHLISWGLLALVVFIHVGLYVRWELLTPFLSIAVLAAMVPLFAGAKGRAEVLLKSLFLWGFFWLTIGLLFEPTEGGGIKKSPANDSYYFVSLGLSILSLAVLTIWIDLFRKERLFRIVIHNGQNPMLAYLGINNLMEPVMALSGANALAAKLLTTPWPLGIWAFVKTAILAVLVSIFTRFKLIWRT